MATKTDKARYIEAIGRRKSATARVRIMSDGKESITVNEMEYKEYFKTPEQLRNVEEALKAAETGSAVSVSAHVKGGGLSAQSEAVRHGLSRALVKSDENNRTALKKAGFLKRDPRSKERKKPGLKKARKSAQWSKR